MPDDVSVQRPGPRADPARLVQQHAPSPTDDHEPAPPAPGHFCDTHWSWRCQEGKGECPPRQADDRGAKPPRLLVALDEDAQDEVLASIEQGLPTYLAADERQRLAAAVFDSLIRNRIVIHPDWMFPTVLAADYDLNSDEDPDEVQPSCPTDGCILPAHHLCQHQPDPRRKS